jgi:hypothetical protein
MALSPYSSMRLTVAALVVAIAIVAISSLVAFVGYAMFKRRNGVAWVGIVGFLAFPSFRCSLSDSCICHLP